MGCSDEMYCLATLTLSMLLCALFESQCWAPYGRMQALRTVVAVTDALEPQNAQLPLQSAIEADFKKGCRKVGSPALAQFAAVTLKSQHEYAIASTP